MQGFAGETAGDEPRAVMVAQNVLSAGGNAVDAATALYFSLAVTLPSTATLGGGGTCLVHEKHGNVTRVVEFPAVAATGGRIPAAIPANVRGFYALQATYGKFRWASLLAPAELMAERGVMVSRALANDLAIAAPRLAADPAAKRIFFHPDGKVLAEGDLMRNYDLAAVIASLRRNPGSLYAGGLQRRFADAARSIGANVTVRDLSDTRPRFVAGTQVAVGDDTAVLPPGDGVAELVRGGAAREVRSAAPSAGTGFVVLDSKGDAVACGITANRLFGDGRVAPGTGIVLAAPPKPGQVAAVPGMVVNMPTGEVHFAGAAGGGNAAAALAATLVATSRHGQGIDRAVAAASVGGSHVNAFHCQSGRASAARCRIATDPRGYGFAVTVGQGG